MDQVTADLWEDAVNSYLSWLGKGEKANPLDEPQSLDYPELTPGEFISAKAEANRMYAQRLEEES